MSAGACSRRRRPGCSAGGAPGSRAAEPARGGLPPAQAAAAAHRNMLSFSTAPRLSRHSVCWPMDEVRPGAGGGGAGGVVGSGATGSTLGAACRHASLPRRHAMAAQEPPPAGRATVFRHRTCIALVSVLEDAGARGAAAVVQHGASQHAHLSGCVVGGREGWLRTQVRSGQAGWAAARMTPAHQPACPASPPTLVTPITATDTKQAGRHTHAPWCSCRCPRCQSLPPAPPAARAHPPPGPRAGGCTRRPRCGAGRPPWAPAPAHG